MIKSEFLRDAIQELNDVSGAVSVRIKLEKSKGMMVRKFKFKINLFYLQCIITFVLNFSTIMHFFTLFLPLLYVTL